jgi:hypothetical protein
VPGHEPVFRQRSVRGVWSDGPAEGRRRPKGIQVGNDRGRRWSKRTSS